MTREMWDWHGRAFLPWGTRVTLPYVSDPTHTPSTLVGPRLSYHRTLALHSVKINLSFSRHCMYPSKALKTFYNIRRTHTKACIHADEYRICMM